MHKTESFWAEKDEVKNMKLNRTIKRCDDIWSSQPIQFHSRPSFYDDGFGHMIRVEADDSETIICDTSAIVVVK